jgi:tRNA-2-methylthio-N6-dimethylallyladenosine synthase
VPYTRGPEVSRPIADIVDEARRLVADGVVEIMLLGQTIDTYGNDLADRPRLWTLLRELHAIEGLLRIRFVTSHPEECREELFSTIHELRDKIMPYIHMPPQSGSDRMLRRMARGYTRQRYVEVVRSAQAQCPGIEFCGDWIVGFCGETDEDFEQSLSLLEEVKFQMSYVFTYSVREGTPAQNLEDDVPEDVKKARHARITVLQEQMSHQKNTARIGNIEEVLVEGPSKNIPSRLAGRSRTFQQVHFTSDRELAGKLVKIKITEATAWSLSGELVD